MSILDNFHRAMASYDADIERLEAEFRAELADPNFEYVPMDIPDDDCPFGLSLDALDELDAATPREFAADAFIGTPDNEGFLWSSLDSPYRLN